MSFSSSSVSRGRTLEQLGLDVTVSVRDGTNFTLSVELVVVGIKDVNRLVSSHRINIKSFTNSVFYEVDIGRKFSVVEFLGVDTLSEDVTLEKLLLFGGPGECHSPLVSPNSITVCRDQV